MHGTYLTAILIMLLALGEGGLLAAETVSVEAARAQTGSPASTSARSAAVASQPLAPLIDGRWRALSIKETRRLLTAVRAANAGADQVAGDQQRGGDGSVAAAKPAGRALDLPFYPGARLIELDPAGNQGRSGLITVIESRQGLTTLDGTASPIHELNAKLPIRLDTQGQVTAYLRFFCAAVHGELGPFRLVERPADIPWRPDATAAAKAAAATRAVPIRHERQPDRTWQVSAAVLNADALFQVVFAIQPGGMVKMLDDSPIAKGLAVAHEYFKADGSGIPRRQRDDRPDAFAVLPERQIGAWLASARALKAAQPALFDGAMGVLVTGVLSDGQGAAAGIVPGDVLLAFGDSPLDSRDEFVELTGKTPPEEPITLRWLRPSEGDADRLEARMRGGHIGVVVEDIAETPLERMEALSDAGWAARDRGRYAEAMDFFRQGLALAEVADDDEWRWRFLRSIGVVFDGLGRYHEALEHLTQALAISREMGDRQGERLCRGSLGSVYLSLGRYPEALEHQTQALAIHREIGDRESEAGALGNVGIVYASLGRYPEALEYFNQALTAKREIGDHAGLGDALTNLGIIYNLIGRYPEALEHHTQALAIFREIGNRASESSVRTNLGNVYHNLARYPEALEQHTKALAIHREIGDRAGEGRSLGNLGNAYRRLGRYPEALEHLNHALAIFREIGDRAAEGAVSDNLGIVYASLGRYPEALEHHTQALAIAREIGDRAGEGECLNNLGSLFQRLGRYPEALGHSNQALALLRELGDRAGESTALLNLGALHGDQGHTTDALSHFQQALALQAGLKEPETLWRLWNNLRQLWEDAANPTLAILAGKRAVNTIQAIRATNANLDLEYQQSFLETKEHVYRGLADLLIAQGRIPEAEQVLAMLKEEELYDFIRRRAAQDDPRTTWADWTPAEAAWNARYDAVADDLAAAGQEYRQLDNLPVRDDAQQQRLAALEEQLDAGGEALIAIVRALEKELAAQGGAAAVAFGEQQLDWLRNQQAMLARLGHGAVLISTVVTEDRLHLILTTPDTQVARQSPIGRAELNRLIVELRQALIDRHGDPKTKLLPLAQRLHAVLVAPIAADLAQAKAGTLMWSLDAALRYIPLAALHDGAHWLIEQHPLAIYTLAARENLSEDTDPAWRVAGLGVSRAHRTDAGDFGALAAVPAELDGIVIRAPDDPDGVIAGELYLDDAFDEARLKAMIRARYPVLHIASHFRLNPGDNSASFLLLGDGSRLTLSDFESKTAYRLDRVDQLTLSACDTAMGNPDRSGSGAEVESFGALAQKRGAKGVLATLWPVADASTGQLMQTLYRLRSAESSLTKAEALRQAQLVLIHTTAVPPQPETRGWVDDGPAVSQSGAADPQGRDRGLTPKTYAHPYYWAPFILMGNWL